ncbi:MAG: hypothetical protein HYY64_18000 [Candidatus Rokubacteria bacterium]|nr:hypothetical protein [Candidatus Rokubacteria bacterium]
MEHPRPLNTLSRDAEELVGAAQAHAERLCELALAQTPVQYHSFIVLLEQRKKVGGTDANPLWAEIRLPYLTVDGRVRMAIDEHEEAGKQLHIETAFVMDPTTGQPLARATVKSEVRGTAVAHARIFLNGGGANRSNPVETGETSAIGRALGFLGYGCFGTGVASADDVLRASRLAGPAAGAGGDGSDTAKREDGRTAPLGRTRPPNGGRTSPPSVAERRAETPAVPQAVFSGINALFDRQKTPGARRVALMKEYRGREGELLRVLESAAPAAAGPGPGPAPSEVRVNPDVDEVPF